jgi:hypothetical protein
VNSKINIHKRKWCSIGYNKDVNYIGASVNLLSADFTTLYGVIKELSKMDPQYHRAFIICYCDERQITTHAFTAQEAKRILKLSQL